MHLVNTLQELIGWLIMKQQELIKQQPLGGDTEALQRQSRENMVFKQAICILSYQYLRIYSFILVLMVFLLIYIVSIMDFVGLFVLVGKGEWRYWSLFYCALIYASFVLKVLGQFE